MPIEVWVHDIVPVAHKVHGVGCKLCTGWTDVSFQLDTELGEGFARSHAHLLNGEASAGLVCHTMPGGDSDGACRHAAYPVGYAP